MVSLLIMSSDNYEDCWEPFYNLKEKYWKDCPYKTYICTETKECSYFDTTKEKGTWTERFRNALEKIDTEYVLVMLEDFFIRDYVDQTRIDTIISIFNDNTAVFNFEKCYELPCEESVLNGFKKRLNKTMYLNSCQPSIHNRLKLIERLQKNESAWDWELTPVDSPYEFYVNCEDFIIDIGYYNHQPWSIKQGQWCKEIIPFFEKEGIEIDYEKRGFCD